MPQQTQIFVGENRDGNSDYEIPPSAEIRVLAVNAEFVDNGAGADWCPAVVMFSDSGSVIARALLPDVKVTAGDDAEASFFPGVKPGGAGIAGASPVVAARGTITTPQTINAGASAPSAFTTVTTSDSARLSWSTGTNTNDTLTAVTASGACLILFASALWNGAANSDIYIQSLSVTGMRHDGWNSFKGSESSPSMGFANIEDTVWVVAPPGGGSFTLSLHNTLGFPNGPQEVTLFAIMFDGVHPS